jgi:small subunit ribosomal protein S15
MNSTQILQKVHVSEQNSGSTESQVFILTEKVARLTSHLKTHNKDYSSQRGLRKILGKRKRLLTYLYNKDIMRYDNLISTLGIRGTKKRSSNAS